MSQPVQAQGRKGTPEESLASRLQLATAGAVNPKARHGGPGKHVSLLLASWQESTRLRVHVEPKSERESWHWFVHLLVLTHVASFLKRISKVTRLPSYCDQIFWSKGIYKISMGTAWSVLGPSLSIQRLGACSCMTCRRDMRYVFHVRAM